jgi:hypothetical protein
MNSCTAQLFTICTYDCTTVSADGQKDYIVPVLNCTKAKD